MDFIIDAADFSLPDTFDCGQCFRWAARPDGSYTGVASGRALTVKKEGSSLILKGCSEKDFRGIWEDYFDLKRDYSAIRKSVCINPVMREAVAFGGGIKLLRQEFFETLISFIISQQSNIPRIKGTVSRLCARYGRAFESFGNQYFAFPDPETLASQKVADFEELGAGYRAKYILSAARAVADGEISASELEKLPTAEARKRLLTLFGVGDKVCDCVLLFSLGKHDLFPADVWIRRVMQERFLTETAKASGEDLFGGYSGFAQQYLFYWRRNALRP